MHTYIMCTVGVYAQIRYTDTGIKDNAMLRGDWSIYYKTVMSYDIVRTIYSSPELKESKLFLNSD